MPPLTKDYFERRLDGAVEALKGSIRDLNLSFIASQAKNDDRFTIIETKLDAIMQDMFTRNEARMLVSQLQQNGLTLDQQKIFLR